MARKMRSASRKRNAAGQELGRLLEERTRELQSAAEKLREAQEKNARLMEYLRGLRRLGVLEMEAQEKISRLLESSPGASTNLAEWAGAMAAEVASAIGARAIGIWEVDRDALTPVSGVGLPPPARDTLERLVSAVGESLVASDEGTIVPVTAASGELCGVLVVEGKDVDWGDTERRLVGGFARQLGGALEMGRMRRRLEVAEERRAATRLEMQARGIATLQVCGRCGRCYDHTVASCPRDGTALESPRPLPYRLAGRYRFLAVLGQGGMGVVFAARDEKLDRDVAVKLVRPEHWSNAETRQRFEREARAVARIQHAGVVALHDSGELDDGTAYLVMERLSGCDLRVLLRAQGRGTPAQVARLVRQGCAALHAAHLAGVIHRDVKPDNVFLVDEPGGFRVKLLDFGLARSLKLEKGLTQTGMTVGTPAYMAPEQVRGEELDTRVDVYSFAAVAYEALTGRQAVQGADLGLVFLHVLATEPPRVSSLLPGIPPEVDAAFRAALAKDPARRPRDIEQWGSSFVDLLESVPPDPLAAGWPEAHGLLARLSDPRVEREATRPVS